MPRLADLQSRTAASFAVDSGNSHGETLILDARAHIRPAQVVESKLLLLMKSAGRLTTNTLGKRSKPR